MTVSHAARSQISPLWVASLGTWCRERAIPAKVRMSRRSRSNPATSCRLTKALYLFAERRWAAAHGSRRSLHARECGIRRPGRCKRCTEGRSPNRSYARHARHGRRVRTNKNAPPRGSPRFLPRGLLRVQGVSGLHREAAQDRRQDAAGQVVLDVDRARRGARSHRAAAPTRRPSVPRRSPSGVASVRPRDRSPRASPARSARASSGSRPANWSGRIPIPTRFERWIRSKLSAMTTFTPSSAGPLAAQSREDPEPYSRPAMTASGTPSAP